MHALSNTSALGGKLNSGHPFSVRNSCIKGVSCICIRFSFFESRNSRLSSFLLQAQLTVATSAGKFFESGDLKWVKMTASK